MPNKIENTANLAHTEHRAGKPNTGYEELHPDNVEFMERMQKFEENLIEHGDKCINEIAKRVKYVGRENIILDPLFEILQILTSCQEKINFEACRIGACTKRIIIPEAKPELSTPEVTKLIMLSYVVIKNQFNAITKFVRKFVNNKYSISSYINMNRLIKAEIDINDSIKEGKKILKVINFLRFQNAAVTVNAALKWLKKARINLHYRRNRMNVHDEGSEQLWNNDSNEQDPSLESSEFNKKYQPASYGESGVAGKMPVFQLKRNK